MAGAENTVRVVAGIDFPRNLQEFDRFFPDEEACRKYVARVRWRRGFRCVRCKCEDPPWITARGYLHCRGCECETSITGGTIFERTRSPLKTWFMAMWLVTSQKYGASALGLQRVLGLRRYEMAWTWLHKLRRAMVRPGRERLMGRIEVDEAYVGGMKKGGKRGRRTERKEIVVIAVEVYSPKGFGRIRMQHIPDVSGASLIPFIRAAVEPGSEVITDGWGGYNKLGECGYNRCKVVVSDTGDPAHVALPGVHKIASLLKRWLLGTHQGAVSHKYLDYYLDEFTFRFNRRTSGTRGMLFYRLMEQALATGPTWQHDIVGGDHNI